MARILVAEDDLGIQRLIQRSLTGEGHEVLLASDGRAALRLLELHEVGLFIIDIFMPDVDGMELLMKIRGKTPDAKIIAISGGGVVDKEHSLVIAERLGAARTLAKPFLPKDLLAVVNEVLGGE